MIYLNKDDYFIKIDLAWVRTGVKTLEKQSSWM